MTSAILQRCPWAGIDDAEYTRYHDEEWGVPLTDDRRLFEKLVLEGFQAGLSWRTILKKRPNFRKAFCDFDASRIACFGARDVERLMQDTGIVRNRAKIEATITNAQAYLDLIRAHTLASFIWGFVDGRPIINHHTTMTTVPPSTDLSKQISKALKAKGFRFVGPTTIYAFMQSSGIVNDHVTTCHRHTICANLQRDFAPPWE